MTAFFRKQKTECCLSQSTDEEQLAEFCVALIQGATLIGKVRGESEAVESVSEEVTTHFEQLR